MTLSVIWHTSARNRIDIPDAEKPSWAMEYAFAELLTHYIDELFVSLK